MLSKSILTTNWPTTAFSSHTEDVRRTGQGVVQLRRWCEGPCPSNREGHAKQSIKPDSQDRETIGKLWLEHAGYAALYLGCSAEGIKSIAWLTGEQALEEERTESHAGLYVARKFDLLPMHSKVNLQPKLNLSRRAESEYARANADAVDIVIGISCPIDSSTRSQQEPVQRVPRQIEVGEIK